MNIVSYEQTCKFSRNPKYYIQLEKPNAFNLEWVYSVPCGEKYCKSWIFINTKTAPEWDPEKKAWIDSYILEIGWYVVVNRNNKRFQCPTCYNPFPPLRI